MPFTTGTTLEHYKIIEPIGAGGMGEVYKATDTRLDRPVALKILPAALVTDSDRVRRFIGEAKAASALNHPHIITIYDIGEAKLEAENPQGIAHYIAMEYVSGTTLHVKIHREHLELKKLLEYFAQTADGLAKAHAAGIVHRDLKPENIMVTEDGYAKILDFGLAKLIEADEPAAPSGADAGEAATAVMDKTRPGAVMGTIGYMSPEQAQGKVVDQRSDIFSFGCILYEAATRHKPFQGDSVIDSLHKIVYGQAPPIGNDNPDAPAELQRIIRKCLAKDPAERYQSIKDIAVDLRDLIREYDSQPRVSGMYAAQMTLTQVSAPVTTRDAAPVAVTEAGTISTTTSGTLQTAPVSGITQASMGKVDNGRRIAMVAGLLLLATVSVIALYFLVGQKGSRINGPAFQNTAISKLTSTGRALGGVISPDGKYVVHTVNEAGKQGLWVRQTATSSNVQIVAPDEGDYIGVTFSRDGNYVYFVKGEKGASIRSLYQVPVLGGTPRKLIDDVDSAISFSRDGKRFAFVRHATSESSLIVVNSDGAGEQKLRTYKQPDVFLQVEWSPDDKVIAASTRKITGGFRSEMVAVQISDGSEKVVGSQRWLAISGFAWLADSGGMVISAVDQTPGSRQLQIWQLTYPEGKVKRITNDLNNYTGVSLSADSRSLVTVQADAVANLWVAPDGDASRARQITSGSGRYDQISLTPDGRLVYISNTSGTVDIWIMDADGKNQKQLTSDAGANVFPAASPGGRYVVFDSSRGGNPAAFNVWRMAIDGSNPKQLTQGEGEYFPVCSPDGKWVVYSPLSSGGKLSLWKIPIDGGDPVQINERLSVKPAISPDGKWIAFQTSGDQPASGPKLGIIPFDGGQPLKLLTLPLAQFRWSADSKAILYLDDKQGVSNVWSQAVDGGAPRQLTKFTADQIFSFDWSRDGKMMACSRGVVTTDVVLIKDSGRTANE
jgi:serine/threonine protein kinase/Tol biopolymer transport system component